MRSIKKGTGQVFWAGSNLAPARAVLECMHEVDTMRSIKKGTGQVFLAGCHRQAI